MKLPSKPKGYTPKSGGGDKGGKPKSSAASKRVMSAEEIDAVLDRVPDVDSPRLPADVYLQDDDVGEPLDLADLGEGGKKTAKGVTVFPAPPSFKMGWDKFSLYWQHCWDDPRVRPRMRVYIYRMFPVMKEGYRRCEILQGSPDVGETPAEPLSIEQILHRYGSGDYHFKMNDSGANNRQICQCDLSNRPKMRNYETHFPILDLEGVDESDPMNKTFLEQLKRRGAAGQLNGDEEMQMTSLVTSLTEKLVDQAQRDRERETYRPDNSGEAVARIMSEAAKASIEMVASTRDRLDKDREAAATGSNPANQLDMLTALMTVAEKMRPDNTALLEAMRNATAREEKASQQHLELMQTIMKSTMEREARKEPEKDSVTRLIELAEAKDQLAKILGVKGAGAASSGTDWAAIAQGLAPVIAPIAQSLQAMAMGFMYRAQGAGGAGMAPNNAQGAPGQPGAGMGGPAGHLGPGTPQGAPVEQPWGDPEQLKAAGVPVELTTQQGALQYLDTLKGPLLRMLNNPDLDGSDFATWLTDWKGEEHYEMVAKAGPDTLLQILMMHPVLASELGPRPQTVARFLEDFIKPYQAALAENADDEDDSGNEDDDGEGDSGGYVNGSAEPAAYSSSPRPTISIGLTKPAQADSLDMDQPLKSDAIKREPKAAKKRATKKAAR